MNHYGDWAYVTENRFASFYYQVKEVLYFEPASVLEIGIGSGIVTSILASRGLTTYTVDTSVGLRPEAAASVDELPIRSASVDVALCAQVLEHLEFSILSRCVEELSRVATKGVVISLPNALPYYEISLAVPILGRKTISMSRSFGPGPTPATMNPSHKWEIGRRGILVEDVLSKIAESSKGTIIRQYRARPDPYRHFFVIAKR
jgi:hypothetical protein